MERFTHFLQLSLIWSLVLAMSFNNVSSSSVTEVIDKCQFSDAESTQVESVGKAKIAPLIGHTYQSHASDETDDWTYTIGICTEPTESSDALTGVIQVNNHDKSGTPPRVIGKLSNAHIMSGSDWVMLEYRGGEIYHSHCGGEEKRSTIVITCDPDIDDSSAKMLFMNEENGKKNDCYYLFEMKHKAVCPTSVASSGLSAGSIFVIIFITLAGVYLLVGFLYSRFILGNKGMEQIPNYEFWQDFGNLQADGCDFICRTRSTGAHHGGLRGLGDDQIDREEVIRDESLLPM